VVFLGEDKRGRIFEPLRSAGPIAGHYGDGTAGLGSRPEHPTARFTSAFTSPSSQPTSRLRPFIRSFIRASPVALGAGDRSPHGPRRWAVR
jgi:hypothetical protein